MATDPYLTPTYSHSDAANLGSHPLMFGQDITFGTGRAAPAGHNVGSSTFDLERKMRTLLGVFAHSEKTGMARALFNDFLVPQSSVIFLPVPI